MPTGIARGTSATRAALAALRAVGAFPRGQSPWNPALRVIGERYTAAAALLIDQPVV